jgi:hypothetical protein
MVNKELLKTAALTLRNLSRERKEAVTKVAQYDKAEELIRKMLTTQEFTGEEVLQKISEFKQMSLGELESASKALELIKGGSLQLGTIAMDNPTPGAMDNLTYYLLYGDTN